MPALRPRQAEDLALRLLARGARNVIVETHTGLSAYVLRSLRKDLGVDHVANGPIPYPGGSALACRETQIHLGLVAAAYRRIGGKGVQARIDIDAVIGAHDLYRRSIEGGVRLDINDAWMVARDLHSGWAQLVDCPSCAVDYLSWDSASPECACPYCALYDRPAGDPEQTDDRTRRGPG
jgi:hypothetical protein